MLVHRHQQTLTILNMQNCEFAVFTLAFLSLKKLRIRSFVHALRL
ncbi:hypothetical protein AE07_02605 [Enterobacter cloacae BWH 43]|nr:hypothetical protein AE07_02605 [Enterobacter cloacae BWH 43]